MSVFADTLQTDLTGSIASWTLGWLTTTTNLIYLVILLFTTICTCILFKKAWRRRREAIIPFWSVYVLCKIIWKKNRFWIFMILPIIWILWLIISFIFYIIWDAWELATVIKTFMNRILGIFTVIAYILIIVFSFIICFRLAKKFGKSDWFWVWLMFLTPIFIWILAFWNAKYIGEENNK